MLQVAFALYNQVEKDIQPEKLYTCSTNRLKQTTVYFEGYREWLMLRLQLSISENICARQYISRFSHLNLKTWLENLLPQLFIYFFFTKRALTKTLIKIWKLKILASYRKIHSLILLIS